MFLTANFFRLSYMVQGNLAVGPSNPNFCFYNANPAMKSDMPPSLMYSEKQRENLTQFMDLHPIAEIYPFPPSHYYYRKTLE